MTRIFDKASLMIELALWCCVSKPIFSEYATVQDIYQLHVKLELPATAPVGPLAFRGSAQVHVVAETQSRVRLLVSVGMFVYEETLIPWRGLQMFCSCVVCPR